MRRSNKEDTLNGKYSQRKFLKTIDVITDSVFVDNIASGVYINKMSAGNFSDSRKKVYQK